MNQSKLAFENQNAMSPDDDRILKWAMVSLTEKYNLKKLCFRPNAETKIEKIDVWRRLELRTISMWPNNMLGKCSGSDAYNNICGNVVNLADPARSIRKDWWQRNRATCLRTNMTATKQTNLSRTHYTRFSTHLHTQTNTIGPESKLHQMITITIYSKANRDLLCQEWWLIGQKLKIYFVTLLIVLLHFKLI